MSDSRKKEHKAIFAHQLRSIHKTLNQDQDNNKSYPKPFGNMEKNSKIEQKSTAFAGRGKFCNNI